MRQLQADVQRHEAAAGRAVQQVETLRQDLMIAHAARSDAEARAAVAMTTVTKGDEVTRDAIAQVNAAQQRCDTAEQRADAAEARAAAAEEHARASAAALEQAEARQDAWHRAAGDAAQLAEAAVAEVAAVRANSVTTVTQKASDEADQARLAGHRANELLIQVCPALDRSVPCSARLGQASEGARLGQASEGADAGAHASSQ